METVRRNSGTLARKSSIETEPRTLNFYQIQDAREAALYVVNSKSSEEALSIFTQGMEPSLRGKTEGDKRNVMSACDSADDELRMLPIGPDCNCIDLRDIVSAPF